MSGTRRQRETVAPSLFPFLAVLLCTMGSLVLILMLIVAGAQTTAQQVAEEARFRNEEIESQIQLAKSAYREKLDDGRIDLEQKRLMLQHYEEHILELLDELEELEKTAELLDDAASGEAEELESTEEKITELEKQLAEAAKKLEQKVEKPDGDKPIFAIVPYEGTNGTHRRPIYLECTGNGVFIQPEGILISSTDLQPPYGPGNPLDAALRTIRAEFVPASGAVTRTAYPLLIVRPSGIRNYALARSAMSGWDDQFGYELIDEDLELTFPESKPGLGSKIAKTIELARDRQAALVMAMPQKYRQSSAPLRGGSSSGGYSSGNEAGSGGGFEQPSSGASLSNSNSYGEHGSGAYAAGGAGGFSLASGASDSSPYQGTQLSGNQAGSRGGDLGFASDTDTATSDQGRLGGSQNNSMSTASSNDPFADLYRSSRQSQGDSSGGSFFRTGGGDASTGSSGTPDGIASRSGNAAGESDGNFAGNSAGQSPGGEAAMQGNPQSVANSGSASQSASQSGAGAMSSGASGGDPNSQSDPSAPAMPQLSLDFSKDQERPQPVASQRGRNWAWSDGPRTQTPVVRSIRLHCFKDRWVLLPDDGNPNKGTTISFDQPPQARAEALAQAVQDRVKSWGLALTGGYWKPVIVVDVAPDAAWRFAQLEQLLTGSGLELRRSPVSQPQPTTNPLR